MSDQPKDDWSKFSLILALNGDELAFLCRLIGDVGRMSEKMDISKLSTEELRGLNRALELGRDVLAKVTAAQKTAMEVMKKG